MGLFDTVGRLFGGWTGNKKSEEDIPPFQFSSQVVHVIEGNPEKHWVAALPSDGGGICLVDDHEQKLEVPTRSQALLIVRKYPDVTEFHRRKGH